MHQMQRTMPLSSRLQHQPIHHPHVLRSYRSHSYLGPSEPPTLHIPVHSCQRDMESDE